MNLGRNPRDNSNAPLRWAVAALLGLAAGACDSPSSEPEPSPPTETAPEVDEEEAISSDDLAEAPEPTPASQMARHQQTAPSSGIATDPVAEKALRRVRAVDPEELEPLPAEPDTDEVAPIAHRIARQTLPVRTEPSHRAALRGRIPMSEAFGVFAFVDGEGEDKGCSGLGWAEVGGGYVCLERTRKAKGKAPRTLPKMRGSGLTPYYYAKVRKGRTAHVYASIEAYRAGADPIDTLQTKHEYAFVGRRMKKGEFFLVNERRQVVPEKNMSRFYPSTFEGIDLEAEPVPEGKLLAWTVQWPETPMYTAPSDDAELAPSLDYHQRLLLDPEPQGSWYALADGSGFVHEEDVRRWTLPEPLDTAAAGEVWVDVDIEQQVLTVMRGKAPVFTTLISSGLKGHTPRGIYRIRLKQATGTMSSDPGDTDTYAVEEVPHVQYFFGGVALHSAFWHNRFGHRMSHGCVNLSPKDAKTVYEMTGPHPQDGWLHVYETEGDLGTTVRLHDGGEPVKDRRDPVEPVFG